jgi:hypothetical protein
MSNTISNIFTDDEIIPYVDEGDEKEASEYAGGSSPPGLSLEDQTPRMELATQLASVIKEVLDAERAGWLAQKRSAVRVTTNLSGQVLFARFSAGMQVIQIVREKELRGDITVVNHDDTDSIFIGLHAGIMHHGTDTVEVKAGAARTIRTRNALWCIAMVDGVELDVQEEFD